MTSPPTNKHPRNSSTSSSSSGHHHHHHHHKHDGDAVAGIRPEAGAVTGVGDGDGREEIGLGLAGASLTIGTGTSFPPTKRRRISTNLPTTATTATSLSDPFMSSSSSYSENSIPATATATATNSTHSSISSTSFPTTTTTITTAAVTTPATGSSSILPPTPISALLPPISTPPTLTPVTGSISGPGPGPGPGTRSRSRAGTGNEAGAGTGTGVGLGIELGGIGIGTSSPPPPPPSLVVGNVGSSSRLVEGYEFPGGNSNSEEEEQEEQENGQQEGGRGEEVGRKLLPWEESESEEQSRSQPKRQKGKGQRGGYFIRGGGGSGSGGGGGGGGKMKSQGGTRKVNGKGIEIGRERGKKRKRRSGGGRNSNPNSDSKRKNNGVCYSSLAEEGGAGEDEDEEEEQYDDGGEDYDYDYDYRSELWGEEEEEEGYSYYSKYKTRRYKYPRLDLCKGFLSQSQSHMRRGPAGEGMREEERKMVGVESSCASSASVGPGGGVGMKDKERKKKPTFTMVVIGCGGGPKETNLSSYFIKPYGKDWDDHNVILGLEGGSATGAISNLLPPNLHRYPYHNPHHYPQSRHHHSSLSSTRTNKNQSPSCPQSKSNPSPMSHSHSHSHCHTNSHHHHPHQKTKRPSSPLKRRRSKGYEGLHTPVSVSGSNSPSGLGVEDLGDVEGDDDDGGGAVLESSGVGSGSSRRHQMRKNMKKDAIPSLVVESPVEEETTNVRTTMTGEVGGGFRHPTTDGNDRDEEAKGSNDDVDNEDEAPSSSYLISPFWDLNLPREVIDRGNDVPVGWLWNAVRTFCITHPHYDHIFGLVVSSTCRTGATAAHVYGLPPTLDGLLKCFEGPCWPPLAARIPKENEEEEEGMKTLLLHDLKECDPSFPLPDTSATDTSTNAKDTEEPTWTSLEGNPHFSLQAYPVNHGETTEGSIYDSTVFFIKELVSGEDQQFMFWGDVESDVFSANPWDRRNLVVWEQAARRIVDGVLSTIFIECSYTDVQLNKFLWGHLKPEFLVLELRNLAECVERIRAEDRKKQEREQKLKLKHPPNSTKPRKQARFPDFLHPNPTPLPDLDHSFRRESLPTCVLRTGGESLTLGVESTIDRRHSLPGGEKGREGQSRRRPSWAGPGSEILVSLEQLNNAEWVEMNRREKALDMERLGENWKGAGALEGVTVVITHVKDDITPSFPSKPQSEPTSPSTPTAPAVSDTQPSQDVSRRHSYIDMDVDVEEEPLLTPKKSSSYSHIDDRSSENGIGHNPVSSFQTPKIKEPRQHYGSLSSEGSQATVPLGGPSPNSSRAKPQSQSIAKTILKELYQRDGGEDFNLDDDDDGGIMQKRRKSGGTGARFVIAEQGMRLEF